MSARVDTHPQYPELVRLGARGGLRDYVRELWRLRDFAVTVPMGDLRAANMDTMLGSLWHLLNPLLLASVYYLLFGVIFQGARGQNFVAFLITGLFTYFFSQKSVAAGSRTVIANMSLMQSISFPRAVLPLSALISEAAAHLPALGLMVVIVFASGEAPAAVWLLLVPSFLLQALFNFGLVCVTARLTFHFRDMQQVLPYALRLWLYLSGVFYSIERIDEGWARTLFERNPMHQFIQINRDLLMHHTVDPARWAEVAVWAVALLVLGSWFFLRKEDEYGRGY